MGIFYGKEVKLQQLQQKRAEREDRANELFKERANVSRGVDILSNLKKQEYERKNCQICINGDYKIKLKQKEMAGSLLSVIEDSFPIESENNVRWIIQQIIHGVTGTYSGFPKPHDKVSKYEQTIIHFPGDYLKIDFHIQSYVYCNNGAFLKTTNWDKFMVRMVIGIKHEKTDTPMSIQKINLLKRKPGLQSDDDDEFDETPRVKEWKAQSEDD